MKAKRTLLALNALLVSILACNLPGGQGPAPQQPDLAATITAQALILLQSSNTPASTSTPAFTEVASLTPTVTLTPTPAVPEVSVTSATNCRTGPGMVYDLLYTMQPGQTATLIGKYSPDNYWIISMAGGGHCWLWGQYAVVSGNTANLPEYPPPPTPTPSLPAKPSGLQVGVSCTLVKTGSGPIFLFVNAVHAEITWQDNAANEDGYYVWRNDTLIATLSPDTTGVEDDTRLPAIYAAGDPPPSVTYTVQAFNATGKSKKISKSVSCGG
jgi:uncharacterized protein YraI